MKSILFLDIDGVLNSHVYLKSLKGFRTTRLDELFDPDAVNRLNKITDATGASIVVSSSWRIGYTNDIDGLRDVLKRNGITAHVVGMTVVDPRTRGEQIQDWLNHNNDEVRSFVILDDTDDMGHLRQSLIKTTYAYGLQDEHVLPAILKLKPVVYT